MSHLKFESFTYENVNINNNQDVTALDMISALEKNEIKVSKYLTDLMEHTDALVYCKRMFPTDCGNTGQSACPLFPKSTIKNKYLTDSKSITNNVGDTTTYVKPCDDIKTWRDSSATFTIRYPTTYTTSTLNDFYNDISENYGKSFPIDLSCVNYLTTLSTDIINNLSNNYEKSSVYTYDQNIQNYNKNIKLRKKLDLAMTELYNGDQSIAMYQKRSLDSVVYANILWTILATSLIYYVFIKI